VTKSILICGVGGQGILLSSDILAEVCMNSGYDMKKSEVHGMAQRGGSVISHVRYGEKVHSPLIGEGGADIILSYEKLEALRNLSYIEKNGTVIVNDMAILPIPVASGEAEYPQDVIDKIKKHASNLVVIDGLGIAKSTGNIRTLNVVLLGVLARHIELPYENWLAVIEERVPKKTIEVNKLAFESGYRSK